MQHAHGTQPQVWALTKIARLAVWALLFVMAFAVWQNQKKNLLPNAQQAESPTFQTSPSPENPSVSPGILDSASGNEKLDSLKVQENEAEKISVESKYPETGNEVQNQAQAIENQSIAPARPAPDKASNYRALAQIFYSPPKYNRENRPENDPILEAEQDLWRKRFSAATVLLDSISKHKPDLQAAQRIRAHVLFSEGKIAAAKQIFDKIKADKSSPFNDDENDWYLLLCHLADAGRLPEIFESSAQTFRAKNPKAFAGKLAALQSKIDTLKREGKL